MEWSDILPDLRAHYDRVIAVWVNFEGRKATFTEPDFDEEEFNVNHRKRRDELANHCKTIVEISVADLAEDESTRHWITKLTCGVAEALLRKTPAEISHFPLAE